MFHLFSLCVYFVCMYTCKHIHTYFDQMHRCWYGPVGKRKRKPQPQKITTKTKTTQNPTNKQTKSPPPFQKRKVFREECSQFTAKLNQILTWFYLILMILLASELAKSVLRQPLEMSVVVCKIEVYSDVLLWMYFFLLLQLCARQTMAASLSYTHCTKNNICYLSLHSLICDSALLRNCLQCRIWVCVCKDWVLLLKGDLQILLEGEQCIAFLWPME